MLRQKYKAHYGIKPIKRAMYVDRLLQNKYFCQSCNTNNIRRVCSGIFKCKKCGHTVIGDAYILDI